MEKKQSELCIEILKRFHKAGVLKEVILIGSWCVYFYKDYFSNVSHISRTTIKTRDIDFLIDSPAKIQQKVNIPELLEDLGFVTIFKGNKGYIKLDHPDLILEFLVPERGKGTDKPVPLPKLGMNAVALRFLNFLSDKTIQVKVKNFYVTLPHPANFALHKLIIFRRRRNANKAVKDRNTAIDILKALVKKGDKAIIQNTFNDIPGKWQKKIISNLKYIHETETAELLLTFMK